MPCPRQQQQQQPIVNGSMPWPQQQPQQQQQQQPQQQLISYDSDDGWVRGGINRGAGVLPPSGNGGDGGGQQRYTGGHGSVDGSSGCNISSGNGDDGYTLVAGGGGPPPNWAVEERRDSDDYTEDDSGPLVGPFGTSQEFSVEDSIIFPTLGPGLHVLARPQQQQRSPPHSMGAGDGGGAVEHQRARPQQQQRPPHSMGAGGGAGAVECQRAWPQQQQQPPQLMGAGGGAEAREHQRAQSQQQQQPPPYSIGAGVGAVADKTQHQRQPPQQELEPSVVTDEAAAATSATDRWIPAAESSTGDGTISAGGSRAGTMVASFTRGQQDHLVVWSSSPGPLQQQRYRVTPAVTRSISREQPLGVSRTFTLLAAEEDIARTLAQPDAVFCDSEKLPACPAHLLEIPETYAQAHTGSYSRIWTKAERKEAEGLSAVGTFMEEGGM